MQSRTPFALIAVAAVLSILAAPADAVDRFWQGPGCCAYYGDFSFWTPGGVPVGADNTFFDLGYDTEVMFFADRHHHQLVVRRSDVTLQLDGHALSLTDADLDAGIYVGDTAGESGVLEVFGGDMHAVKGVLGSVAGSTGTIWMRTGSTWAPAGLDVGIGGTGELRISNGADVGVLGVASFGVLADSLGLLTIENAGSTLNTGPLTFARAGNATGLVWGGTMTSGDTRIGTSAGSEGSFLFFTGTTWQNNGDANVGLNGTGTLSLGGIATTTGSATVGTNAGGSGVVSIVGGTWNLGGTLTTGVSGAASVSVTDGGTLNINGLGVSDIALVAGSTGTVSVSGTGSTWFCDGVIRVGVGGTGSLTVTDDGAVFAHAVLVMGSGRVTVGENGTLSSGNLGLQDGAVLDGCGSVTGPVTNTSGIVRPGCSPGTLTITGAYRQFEAGVLALEVAGAAPGDWDVLDLGSPAELSGRLEIELIGGYEPTAVTTLEIIHAPSISGSFDELAVDGAAVAYVAYHASSVEVVLTPYCIAADLDGDGTVGFNDLAILLGTWGSCHGDCAGDLNLDGGIGFGDLALLIGNWGPC